MWYSNKEQRYKTELLSGFPLNGNTLESLFTWPNNKQHHKKVLLNELSLKCHTLVFLSTDLNISSASTGNYCFVAFSWRLICVKILQRQFTAKITLYKSIIKNALLYSAAFIRTVISNFLYRNVEYALFFKYFSRQSLKIPFVNKS